MTVIVVGLGPGSAAHLTVEAERVLRSAGEVYLRTGRHPIVSYLRQAGLRLHTFDEVYERSETLPEVYKEIVRRLTALDDAGGERSLIYAVPGHPLVGETTTRLLLDWAQREGRSVQIVAGLSFVEPALTALGIDALDGLQIADALDLTQQPFPTLDPDRGALIGQTYSREVASDLKLTLGVLYPDEHRVTLVRAAGTEEQEVREVPLFELDRQAGIDHLTCVYVPPLPQAGSWGGLQTIVARLRAPGGCPWDREQTHRTLRAHLLDEVYEVLDALDRADADDLAGELGDLALQIALHMQIAIEEGEFTPTDVFGRIIAKLRRRHPHVFGDVKVSGAGEVMVNWEHIKRQERGAADHHRIFEGVPASLPALAQALTFQERAARVGYEPVNGEEIVKGLEAWLCTPAKTPESEAQFGELLFALVAAARRRAINPESALREASRRFAKRFTEEGPTSYTQENGK